MGDNKAAQPTFSQVFIKTEPGSTSSLLSIDSPILQNTASKEFVIGKAIEKSFEEHLYPSLYPNVIQRSHTISTKTVKLEPYDFADDVLDDNAHLKITSDHTDEQMSIDYHDLCDQNVIEDDVQAKKLQIIENETTVYRCQECEKVFKKYPEYKMHRTEHSVEKRTCKICHILFQGIVKLNEHMNTHQGIKPFKCAKCKKSFASANTLKCHMECHRTENIFKCEKCGKGFKTKRSLRGHMDTHAKKIKEYVCKICNEEFDFSTEYRRHLIKHGAEPPQPKCRICDKDFKYESQLKAHLSTHKELKFPCEYCNKIFLSMTKIRKHVKRTHVINECEFCKEVFYDKAEFARHKKSEHVEEKPNICKYCQKAYDKQKNLQEHIRVQHTEDGLKNKCEICDKTFINRFLLNNHIKTHDKCFRCPSCNSQFASRYNLQLHSVTHTNEKKYKCTLCSKAYSLKVSLQTHISTHSEDRPYSCSQCEKTFKNNRRLYVHKKSHETELKFECYTCGNKFKTKSYLKAHMYKHYKVRPFNCPHCDKQFKHKKTAEKHIDTKHLRTNRAKRKNIQIIEDSIKKEKQEETIPNSAHRTKEIEVNCDGMNVQQNGNLLNLEVQIKMDLNGFVADKNINGDSGKEGGYGKETIDNEQKPQFVHVKVEVNDE